jgi:2-polyprenyl-3-methyl-5-hydroxy-6-metoxy-1,4-benzoquinol methylase
MTVSDIYSSGEYAAKNPTWHQEHSQWKAAQVRRMLEKHGIRPRRLAEAGCGAGGILESLHRNLQPQPECVGYEISPQAFAMAQRREAKGLQFRLGLPGLNEDSFDVVMAMDVLEHVEDYLGFIRGLRPLARWKILHIPLDLSVVSLAKPIYMQMARKYTGHLHYFTRETALATVEQAGLKVKDWFYTSLELDQGTYGQKRIQLLRKMLFHWKPDLAVRWLGGFSILVLAE